MTQIIEKLRHWISEVPLVSVVIGVLAFYGIFKNLFNNYLESEKGEKGSKEPSDSESHMLQFGDQMADLVSNRLFTWGGVSVIAFILTMILKHYNDKYDEQEAIRRELEEEEAEDEANKEDESEVKSKKNKKPSSTKNKNKNEKTIQSKQKKTN